MNAGDILTHTEACQAEGQMLQRGMTFRHPPAHGIILMSQRANAPYQDTFDSDGNLAYEGHDMPRTAEHPEPKRVDQPRLSRRGRLTENGKFAAWTDQYKQGHAPAARFHVYEKVQKGIWTFRGQFLLVDYSIERSGPRHVFRFILRPTQEISSVVGGGLGSLTVHDLQTRQIPGWVKQHVYKRDRGQCSICGARDSLHYDHDLPYSKGGASATPANVRLLCSRHNLAKSNKIE